jgi:hypothetical protein
MDQDIHFNVVSSYKEFLSLKNDWEKLLRENSEDNFYLSFDWFYSILSFSKKLKGELYIITIHSRDKIVAIIPCCAIGRSYRFFKLRCIELLGNIYSPYRGCIIKKQREKKIAELYIRFLLSEKKNEWDVLNFENVSMNDSFIIALKETLNEKRQRLINTEQYPNYITDLTRFRNYEKFFRNLPKGLRKSIKLGINRNKRFGSFYIELFKDENHDIERAVKQYYQIYSKSWKKEEHDPDFHGRLARYLIKKQLLRLFILYHCPNKEKNEKEKNSQIGICSYESEIKSNIVYNKKYVPIAVLFSVIFDKQAYYLKMAYNEDYAKNFPGTVLLWFAAKYFLEVEKIANIDYQKGKEEFKERWGKIKEIKSKIQVANPKSKKANFEFFIEYYIIPIIRAGKKFINKFTK